MSQRHTELAAVASSMLVATTTSIEDAHDANRDAFRQNRRRVLPKSETRLAKIGDGRETRRCYTEINAAETTNTIANGNGAITGLVAPTGLHHHLSYPKGDSV